MHAVLAAGLDTHLDVDVGLREVFVAAHPSLGYSTTGIGVVAGHQMQPSSSTSSAGGAVSETTCW